MRGETQKHKSPDVINERRGERQALSRSDQICFSECDLYRGQPVGSRAIAALQNTFGRAPSWLRCLVSLSTASRLCWQGCSTTKRKKKTQNPSEVLFFFSLPPPQEESSGLLPRRCKATQRGNSEKSAPKGLCWLISGRLKVEGGERNREKFLAMAKGAVALNLKKKKEWREGTGGDVSQFWNKIKSVCRMYN